MPDGGAPTDAGTSSGPAVVTLGCRLNIYESGIMAGHAAAAGHDDTVIINTCAVTAEAQRQSRQAVRRARRDRPGAHIIVTGCAAQLDPGAFAAMPEVDRVLGNAEKLRAESFALSAPAVQVGDIMAETAAETAAEPGLLAEPPQRTRARAYLQVQTGCDHRCTFCIIPFARGNARSVPMGAIVQHLRDLAAQGVNEVALTGVNITSYGADLPGRPTFAQMLRRILLAVPELPRLRLSSLDPADVDDELATVIANEPRLMPHIHLSIQAGNDMVLKRMRRRHSRAQAIDVAQRLRAARPGLTLGADLIAGFPTETEAMFADTLAFVTDAGLTFLHVFPYSPRQGTPAARMPEVAKAERGRRAAALRARGDTALATTLAGFVGQRHDLLVESETTARTPHYAPVRLDCPSQPGTIVTADLTASDPTHLSATVVPATVIAAP